MQLRRLAALTAATGLAVGGAFTATAAATAGSAPHVAPAAARQCKDRDISVRTDYVRAVDSATDFYAIVVHNKGDQPCTVEGFPKVDAMWGNSVAYRATHLEDAAPWPVTIPAHEGVITILEVLHGGGECEPTRADGLRVTVPGTRTAHEQPQLLEICGLRVSEVTDLQEPN